MQTKGMRFLNLTLVFGFVFLQLFAKPDKTIHLSFKPVFNDSILQINAGFYKLGERDSIHFETFKFYISGIEFIADNKAVWEEASSFHLLDSEHENSFMLELEVPSDLIFDQLKFKLGIDSITNVSGAMGGDLDATKGMYWTWQSGYINVKLEGKSNLCATRKNEFQFHLGGYQSPYNALQTVCLNLKNNEKVTIELNLKKLLSEIDLRNTNQIMTPMKEAVLISEKLAKSFSIKQ